MIPFPPLLIGSCHSSSLFLGHDLCICTFRKLRGLWRFRQHLLHLQPENSWGECTREPRARWTYRYVKYSFSIFPYGSISVLWGGVGVCPKHGDKTTLFYLYGPKPTKSFQMKAWSSLFRLLFITVIVVWLLENALSQSIWLWYFEKEMLHNTTFNDDHINSLNQVTCPVVVFLMTTRLLRALEIPLGTCRDYSAALSFIVVFFIICLFPLC